jgi:NAD(P)-dependent dehydrogenase (short-subunit alcohol dehydrogenase family)
MTGRTWLITGISNGFGRELTSQLLDRGDRVIGTVRDTSKSPTSPNATRTRSSLKRWR